MKKGLLFVLVVLCFLFITACGSKTTSDEHTEKNGNKTEKTSEQKKEHDVKDNQQKNEKEEKSKEKETEKVKPKYEISDQWSIVPIKDADEKVVLLTFDDAPDENALDIAKTVKKLDARAIFFVNGHFLESDKKKKMLKKIYDMGFMIGNHTYDHEYLPDLSEKKQKEEIVRVDDMVKDITGEKPKFFRAPNGANTDYSKKIIAEEGMLPMNWSYGYDWHKQYQNKEAITDIMLHTDLLANGSNLLMHDRKWTSEAIEDIVTGLRDKGYDMVDPHEIKTKDEDK